MQTAEGDWEAEEESESGMITEAIRIDSVA